MGTLSAVRPKLFLLCCALQRGEETPLWCGNVAHAPERSNLHRRVLSTNAIKDTVSVLYWYEELSSFDWQFLGRIFGSFFLCRLKVNPPKGLNTPPPQLSSAVSQKRAGSSAGVAGKAPPHQHHPQKGFWHSRQGAGGRAAGHVFAPQPARGKHKARHCVRPYLVESTTSRPICEVKQPQA